MLLLLAYLLDAVIGDPAWFPHPVVRIGHMITALEKQLRSDGHSDRLKIFLGGVLVTAVLLTVAFYAWLLVHISYTLHPLLGHAVTVILLFSTLAVRCLQNAAETVYLPLKAGNLQAARQAVGMIVGRDTQMLQTAGTARAAVETVAENTVDGVTAPLFYALLGGAPLALCYKAVNTMDSMLGYKNEKYLFFGRAAARLDDAANWLPARLTFPVMLLAAAVLRLDVKSACRAVSRDAKNHPSPNSGWAEAAAAGALGIRLGGENRYNGQVSKRPYLWREGNSAKPDDIRQAVLLMRVTSVIFLLLGLLLRAAIIFLFHL